MRNYAGHRLAPWLAHVMVSRQETARPLLTPGEVMQLPATDELVLVSGMPPIRARKLRYFKDRNFAARVLPAPALAAAGYADCPKGHDDDWTGRSAVPTATPLDTAAGEAGEGGLQQQRAPALPGRRRAKRAGSEQFELIGLGDDDANPVVDAQVMAPAGPVLAAHAVNGGSDRGSDLMPSF
jgi:type IV secretion system protein VirD4